ncbi:hypothetical protein [Streptomyces sp. NPDC029003]|uniref:hypothetical protein n=1 Tax=Streptomyces sp. NPDC029003 TaxID=3155125 RepID=UPI0033D8DB42
MTGERPVEQLLRQALTARAQEVTVVTLRPADPPGPHLRRRWHRRSTWTVAGLGGLAAAALAGYLVLGGPDAAPPRPVPPAAPPELTSPTPSAVPSTAPPTSPFPSVSPSPSAPSSRAPSAVPTPSATPTAGRVRTSPPPPGGSAAPSRPPSTSQPSRPASPAGA